MQPVTDPGILAQLNAGMPPPAAPQQPTQAPQALTPVTDPTTLAQLNGSMDKTKGDNANVPSYLNPGTMLGGVMQTFGKALNMLPGNIPGNLGMTDSTNLPAGIVGGLNQLGEGIGQKAAQIQGSLLQQQYTTQNINDVQQGLNNLPGAEGGAMVGRNALLAASPARAVGIGLMAGANRLAAPDASGQETLPQTAGMAALEGTGAALGAKALSAVGNKALNWLTNKAPEGIAGDVRPAAQDVQDILKAEHGVAKETENKAWTTVREQAKSATLPNSAVNDLHQILIDAGADANDISNPALGRQAAKFSRFAQSGQEIPAQTVLDTRQALSKASQNDAGLRPAVNAFDQVLKDKLGVTGIDDAVAATSSRYQNFVDQKAIARTVEEGSTPETAAKLFKLNDPQASDTFGQVLKATKSTGGDVAKVRTSMQSGITNNILNEAIRGSSRAGEPLVSPNLLANTIQELRTNNQSLWNQLPAVTRQSLSTAEQSLRPYGGVAGKVIAAGKGAINLGLKAAPKFVGDAVEGATAGESLIPLSKVSKMIKLPNGGALANSAELTGAIKSAPAGAITRSPLGNQQGFAKSDTLPILAGGSAGAALAIGAVNNALKSGLPPSGGNRPPNTPPNAMQFAPPPPLPTQPFTTPSPTTAIQPRRTDDQLGNLIDALGPAAQISRTVIAKEEGNSPVSYVDSTGHKTVGTGFNMDAPNARKLWGRAGVPESFDSVYNGTAVLSPASDAKLFGVTGKAALQAGPRIYAGYDKLGDNQKAALTSLVYQLGQKGAEGLKKTLQYLKEGNGKAVENSLINTKVGQIQAPARIKRQALMLAYNMSHEDADRQLAQQGRIKQNERKY